MVRGAMSNVYYKCLKCPLTDECSDEHFKKWKIWGTSADECKHYHLALLRGSGLRKRYCEEGVDREGLHKDLLEVAEIVEVDEPPTKKKTRSAAV